MIYPHNTVAPSIHTDFINGVKFDICEVEKSCYNMLTSSKSRFFVCVEDNHICFHEGAEKFFNATNEVRWDFFCKTKSECIDLIKQFSDAYDSIEKLLERAESKPALKVSSMDKVNSIRTKMMNIFKTYPL
jgi:1-deoxy-D-xylulose 5-phosphate reductoisomerase